MKLENFIFQRMSDAGFYIPLGGGAFYVEVNGSCQDIRLEGDGIDVTDLSIDDFKKWVASLSKLVSALEGETKDLEKNWPEQKS